MLQLKSCLQVNLYPEAERQVDENEITIREHNK